MPEIVSRLVCSVDRAINYIECDHMNISAGNNNIFERRATEYV